MTETTRLGTRVPRVYNYKTRLWIRRNLYALGVPGYVPEYYDHNKGLVPWYLAEYDKNNQVRYSGTPDNISYKHALGGLEGR